jgi:CheY-like chemotaxis protein
MHASQVSMNPATESASAAFPPVVLLVEDDRDTLDMYSTYFELSGVWVTPSSVSTEAVGGAAELRPDVVVIDAAPSRVAGAEVLHTLKARSDTHDIPVILLSGGHPQTLDEADLCLVKPVLPDVLLRHVQDLAARHRAPRIGSEAAIAKPAELIERSEALRVDAQAITGDATGSRRCPECGTALGWLETGRLGGSVFDYYEWCGQGCGLYCFDRAATTWVKLA